MSETLPKSPRVSFYRCSTVTVRPECRDTYLNELLTGQGASGLPAAQGGCICIAGQRALSIPPSTARITAASLLATGGGT